MKREYKIIVEKDEDGYYVASVPSLPGCYTQALDIDTLHARLKEVIELCEEERKSSSSYSDVVDNFSYNPTSIKIEDFVF